MISMNIVSYQIKSKYLAIIHSSVLSQALSFSLNNYSNGILRSKKYDENIVKHQYNTTYYNFMQHLIKLAHQFYTR